MQANARERERFVIAYFRDVRARKVVVVSKNAQPGEMISPISAGGGSIRTGICTIVDMDSREIEVEVNEERFHYAIANSTENFALFDANEKLVVCNANYRKNSPLGAAFFASGPSYEDIITALADHGHVANVEEHHRKEWIAVGASSASIAARSARLRSGLRSSRK